MGNDAIRNQRFLREGTVTERFLDAPSEESFSELFKTYVPQLVAYFRSRGCTAIAEDLAQEVMLTVHSKAEQVRERSLFRAWMFKIAHNALCKHFRKQSREVETVDMAEIPDRLVVSHHKGAGTPAFEFLHWIGFLDSRERETLKLRFIEQWEYHEIATAQAIPIGTVQWRVFSAKKKLAVHLKTVERAENPLVRNAA